MAPLLYDFMSESHYEMTPYVNAWGGTPDKGFSQFLDLPRYSTGYVTLFHTLGFMTETHMLKPYNRRVESTYAYLLGVLDFLSKEGKTVVRHRNQAKELVKVQQQFPVTWKLDRSQHSDLLFKGYEPEYRVSEVTGQQRLKYNRNRPFERIVPYYNHYIPDIIVDKPDYYFVAQGWHDIIERLQSNGVEIEQFERDTIIKVEVYYIEDYSSPDKPWEGHYFHSEVEVRKASKQVQFYKGDYKIAVNQWVNRYIIETLEPQAADSFFRWNYFDTILGQKEHYSAYVFEDYAKQLLADNPRLKTEFEEKRKSDPEFSKSSRAQLDFIYQRSSHYEKEYRISHVFRYSVN
ncbi:MAG: hypothetical protein AAFR14_05215 [Bacteroidota bacterium]